MEPVSELPCRPSANIRIRCGLQHHSELEAPAISLEFELDNINSQGPQIEEDRLQMEMVGPYNRILYVVELDTVEYAYNVSCIPHFSNGTILQHSQTLSIYTSDYYDGLPLCLQNNVFSTSSMKCADQDTIENDNTDEIVFTSMTQLATLTSTDILNTNFIYTSTSTVYYNQTRSYSSTKSNLFIYPTASSDVNIQTSHPTSSDSQIGHLTTSSGIQTNHPTSSDIQIGHLISSDTRIGHPTTSSDIHTSHSTASSGIHASISAHPTASSDDSSRNTYNTYVYLLISGVLIFPCIIISILVLAISCIYYKYKNKRKSSVTQSWPNHEPYQMNANYIEVAQIGSSPQPYSIPTSIIYRDEYAALSYEKIDPVNEYQTVCFNQ